MTLYVDHVLQQPTSLTISSEHSEHRLTFFPSPPNSEDLTTRLDNVSATLKFLSTHFMAFLPPSEAPTFSRSLCKPIVTSVLSNLLIPSLPSSFELLPQFIGLAKQAVAFEDEYVIQLLGDDKSDRPIKAWVDGMGGHYERQRRLQILDISRIIILSPESAPDRFVVEIDMRQDKAPEVVPVQADEDTDSSWGFEEKPLNGDGGSSDAVDDGWGFNNDAEPEPAPVSSLPATESVPPAEDTAEDGWGFDDEDETAPEPSAEPQAPPETNGHDEPDSDAWGWNDDAPADSAEDPWLILGRPSSKIQCRGRSTSPPVPSVVNKASIASPASTSSPKCDPLRKTRKQGQEHLNGSSPMSSPALSAPMSSAKSMPVPPPTTSPAPVNPPEKRPPRLATVVPKETYLVSGRMRQIITSSRTSSPRAKNSLRPRSSRPSRRVRHRHRPAAVAASILDLYRALYPVKFAGSLKTAPDAPMQFSNDCLYLSGEIARMENAAGSGSLAPVKDRLAECRQRLKVLGESWFEDTVEQHRQSANDIIAQGAEGFTFTGDQDRYDECETAVSRVVREIKHLAKRWKGILNKSKYYTAIGMVTEAALSRVLEDILALPDIPEVESHRLSELCRLLHALEALFIEDANQASLAADRNDPFVVAYVPSWLKFSYLSELLEASMVDISYLFDSGALVDFEVDELVRLVRALFADTALRTNTINKLMAGRP
ncbi:hypothetical protein B0H13DRAFT_1925320 [Mycena leptocephala]|nr:hypothetical protein B0H13DRAFT_1925320 [Mycena leptocephala]